MNRPAKPRILLIGQAPPRHETEPYGRTRFYSWLSTIGITKTAAQKLFMFEALVDKFPRKHPRGHDLKPSRLQMEKHRPRLLAFIKEARPLIIVPVGILTIRQVLNSERFNLSGTVGKTFFAAPFGLGAEKIQVIPLPHPSGLNAWVHRASNSPLLNKALSILAIEIQIQDSERRAK